MFLVSLVVIINIYSVYGAGVAPLPTPGPTQTARVDTVIERVEVTAVPTITVTRWPTATRAPYLSPTPSTTPTPIWMSDPASGRMGER